jgi:hypothetical protein
MFFKPKPLIEKQPLRVFLLFSNGLTATNYLFSELEKDSKLAKKITFVGALTNNSRAQAINVLSIRRVDCRVMDEMIFIKKKALGKENAEVEYLRKIRETIAEFKPDVVLSDGFTIESQLLNSVFSLPVVESVLTTIEGKGIITFLGENAVRNAILSSKRELQAGAFLTIKNKIHLVALSRKLPLDLKRLSEIRDSEEFEKYVGVFKEKFSWSCSGPATLQALKLLADGRIGLKGNKIYIKEDNEWLHGFYNLTTECVQSYYGLKV